MCEWSKASLLCSLELSAAVSSQFPDHYMTRAGKPLGGGRGRAIFGSLFKIMKESSHCLIIRSKIWLSK